jgi:hypothetical protein
MVLLVADGARAVRVRSAEIAIEGLPALRVEVLGTASALGVRVVAIVAQSRLGLTLRGQYR